MKKLSGSDVLVVDDNSANTLVLKAMVERYGVHADTAESGMEAIEKTCSKVMILCLWIISCLIWMVLKP